MRELLIKVNKNDKIIGAETKEKCHLAKGILHRGLMIFIFNDKNQLLIQKRSKKKMLWPFFWENSCSSHPQRGESYLEAGKKNLKRELGIICQLKFLDKVRYSASFKKIGSENEICAILVGQYSDKVKPNSKEIAAWQWVKLEKLKKDLRENPQKYTPWFKIGLKKILKNESFK